MHGKVGTSDVSKLQHGKWTCGLKEMQKGDSKSQGKWSNFSM